jgi:pimeloyl-ACP methyl ester carboxylesterase
MRTFFFGTRRRLYGTLHEPQRQAKSTGVLLCYPGVQEYNMTHWAFRKLAGLLAREGLPVLRFDWSCTGDSEGDVYDSSVSHWVEDVATAADELRDAAGVRRVSIIGMRLGALLAARAVSQGIEVRDLLLWEPVFRGADYISDLERLDHEIATRRHHRIEDPRVELAGYPFPTTLRAAISGLALHDTVPKQAGRVAMFLKAEQPEAADVASAWSRAGLKVTSQVVREESGGVTEGAGEGDSAVLYTHMLTAMANELTLVKAPVVAA